MNECLNHETNQAHQIYYISSIPVSQTIDSLSELNVVHQTTLVTIETNVNASARDIRKTDPERSRRALAGEYKEAIEP